MHPRTYQKIANETLAHTQTGHQFRLRVTGNSMFPILQNGEDIFITSLSPHLVMPGDLLSVQWQDEVITHRLLEKSEEHLILMGDNFSYRDPPVPAIALLGKVYALEKHGKQVQLSNRIEPLSAKSLVWLGKKITQPGQAKWATHLCQVLSLSIRWLTRVTYWPLHKNHAKS